MNAPPEPAQALQGPWHARFEVFVPPLEVSPKG